MAHPSHVALHLLSIDPKNIRKAGAGADDTFVASIQHAGIIEPLIARPCPGKPGEYLVTNGGKRLASLRAMAKSGMTAKGVAVTDAYPVPIMVRDDNDAQAVETSLITSIVRVPAHAVDQFEAFVAMREGKPAVGVAEIAKRFGITEKTVNQRLALGGLAPMIRDAWREGHITAEVAMAFTLSTDQKDQARVYKQVTKDGDRPYANGIKNMLVGKGSTQHGGLVTFVGKDVYESAGGTVMVDLFGGNHAVSDVELLMKLANTKIETACADLTAAGWSWAVPEEVIKNRWQYGAINKKGKPTKDEAATITKLENQIKACDEGEIDDDDAMDDIREELETLLNTIEAREFSDKDRKRSGCEVKVSRQGKLIITYGLIAPEAKKGQPLPAAIRAKGEEDAAPAPKAPPKLSEALKKTLTTWAAKATQVALTAQPYKDDLSRQLAKLVAHEIETDRSWGTPHGITYALPGLRAMIDPKVMNEAVRKVFDAKDYFARCPQSFRLRALKEMGHDAAAPKKSGETIALCAKLAQSSHWAPPDLRTPHYDGPGGKATKTRKTKR